MGQEAHGGSGRHGVMWSDRWATEFWIYKSLFPTLDNVLYKMLLQSSILDVMKAEEVKNKQTESRKYIRHLFFLHVLM